MTRSDPHAGVGEHLRRWRHRAGLSQMAVALDCGLSTRHLSFVETGRSRPSRELILHLARHLRPTSRSLNRCLLAAGYAPEWLGDAVDPSDATDVPHEMVVLHDPNPAFVFDADWRMRRLNAAGQRLCRVVMPDVWATVREPSLGVDMIAALGAEGGMLSRLVNPHEVGLALLEQLRLEQLTNPRLAPRADVLETVLERRYGTSAAGRRVRDPADASLRLELDAGPERLSFVAIQMVVGIPQEITVGSLRTEVWYPADGPTRRWLSDDLASSSP